MTHLRNIHLSENYSPFEFSIVPFQDVIVFVTFHFLSMIDVDEDDDVVKRTAFCSLEINSLLVVAKILSNQSKNLEHIQQKSLM